MSFHKKLYSRNFFIANLVILGVVLGLAFAFVGRGTGVMGNGSGASLPVLDAESPAVQVSPETGAALSQAEAVQNAFRYVAATVSPSVVELDVVEKAAEASKTQDTIPFDFFFGPQNDNGNGDGQTQPYKQEGLGSGVIVRRDGNTVYVLTNDHVAGNADKITVIMQDGREFPGTLVGTDERKDIALVKFESPDKSIVVAKLGNSSKVEVGDWAIAFGSPYGLVSSMTTGIVSAIGRSGGPDGNINDFIQTDAAINKGNSGGALANIRGEVVGINTWIASPTGGSIGLGFAIPIDNVKGAIDDFIAHGQIKYGWLGVSLHASDSDKANARELGIEGKKGAFVAHVFLDGPAAKGGILPGDFVVSFDGKDIKTQDSLVRMVGDVPAGNTASIGVIRNGKRIDLKVRIDARNKDVASSDRDLFPGLDVLSLGSDRLDGEKLPKGVGSGVYVTNVIARSPAASMGVKIGDIVSEVNGKKVSGLGEFYAALNDTAAKKIVFTVTRDGQRLETLAYVKK
ncbi:MAG: Do family serine endopeptidase [Rectinema sp.]